MRSSLTRRARATVLAALLTLSLAFTGAAPVEAHNVGVGCASQGVTIALYGSQFYVQSAHHWCTGLSVPNYPDMSLIRDTDDSNCIGGIIDWGHWSNCVTSVQITFTGSGTAYHVCLFEDINYGGNGLDVVGNWSNDNLGTIGWSDRISSLRVRADGLSCLGA